MIELNESCTKVYDIKSEISILFIFEDLINNLELIVIIIIFYLLHQIFIHIKQFVYFFINSIILNF